MKEKADFDSENHHWFGTTHWSVVLAAGEADPTEQRVALETLCTTYWAPVYGYLRTSGCNRADAQDLTQGFFAHLLTRNAFANLSPQKGTFRSFLLKTLKHFLADEHERAQAAKRGGGCAIVPIDASAIELCFGEEAVSDKTPELRFDRRWAMTVLNQAFLALQKEFLGNGKAAQLVELSVFLAAEGTREDYAAVAGRLGMMPGTVAVAVHRLRQRYRDCIRAVITATVSTPAEVDEEMHYLLEVLCS